MSLRYKSKWPWGEIFGDDAVAIAMIDRLIHHAAILSLKDDGYRLKGHTNPQVA